MRFGLGLGLAGGLRGGGPSPQEGVLAAGFRFYTLTGQDDVLRRGLKLGAAADAFTLSGQAAAIRAIHNPLSAVKGDFTLDGQDMFRAYDIVTSVGAFTLTGLPVKSIDLSYVTTAINASALTVYTFAAQSFGTAAADRYVVVGIAARVSSAVRTISSVTIGGVTATLVVSNEGAGDGSTSLAAQYIALVPTGTTGDVVITFSGAMARVGIGIWRMTGISSAVPHDTGVDSDATGGADMSTTLDTVANGALIAIEFYSRETATTAQRYAAGSVNTAEANRTVTAVNVDSDATWTGVTENIDAQLGPGLSAVAQSLVAASWAPA